jgi:SAM-dependent methyltransferase
MEAYPGSCSSDGLETADIETSSEGYATRFAGPVGAWLLAVQEAATMDLLAAIPGRRVLDVGGGHGQLTAPLIRRGYQVTVFGSAASCGDRIRNLIDSGQCNFRVGDLLDLPFPPRSFDIVLSYRLLPHVSHWRRLVGELARVAEWAVLVDFPTRASVNLVTPGLFRLKKQLEGNTRPYLLFEEAAVVDAFAGHGFQLTGRRAQFTLPMVLHRTMKLPVLSSWAEAVCQRVGLTERWGSPVIVRMERATETGGPCGS